MSSVINDDKYAAKCCVLEREKNLISLHSYNIEIFESMSNSVVKFL